MASLWLRVFFCQVWVPEYQCLAVPGTPAVWKARQPCTQTICIQFGTEFSGKVGTCLYVGPFSNCKPAHEALTQFIKDKGHEATGVAYEFYQNDPATVKPDELQTQIYFPLE